MSPFRTAARADRTETEPRAPFSFTPKDSSFYPLFTASAENLVAATEVLGEFVHDHARRAELAVRLRDLSHVGDQGDARDLPRAEHQLHHAVRP